MSKEEVDPRSCSTTPDGKLVRQGEAFLSLAHPFKSPSPEARGCRRGGAAFLDSVLHGQLKDAGLKNLEDNPAVDHDFVALQIIRRMPDKNGGIEGDDLAALPLEDAENIQDWKPFRNQNGFIAHLTVMGMHPLRVIGINAKARVTFRGQRGLDAVAIHRGEVGAIES